jgi:hypothetical protein
MQVLTLLEDIFDSLEKGKLTTIRKGRRDIKLGDLLFESVETKRQELVYVISVHYCRLADVPLDDLQNDGFIDHQDLAERMKRFYPDIILNDEVTVVKFEKVSER